MRKEIVEYLTGPRDYSAGVALYNKYGANLMLKRAFALDQTVANVEILHNELAKLAGLSSADLARLPKRAKCASCSPISADDAIEEMFSEPKEAVSSYKPASETTKKMIRFRDKYTFLSEPDCPDVLKVLVADMFTAYGNYRSAFARLQVLGDEESEKAAAECEAIVEQYLANREIWEELEYYQEHHVVLGKAAKFREMEVKEDISQISDVDLVGKLRSAQVNLSKQKKALAKAEAEGKDLERVQAAVKKWTERKALLEEELAVRKKK